jgi:NAD(P)-dependent dehydrogenase (short-subunit alcohol dehydrogenase family)
LKHELTTVVKLESLVENEKFRETCLGKRAILRGTMAGEDQTDIAGASLRGARVVIVGGSSGIGLGAAKRLDHLGASVIIAGRDASRLQSAAAAVGGGVTTEQVDARSAPSAAAMFARVGRFDHLILTLTGRLGGGEFASLSLDELRRAFDEKYWAHLTAAQASLATLSRRGSLTFVTGISARKVNPGGGGFAAINGALEIMTPTLARELAPLRVNAVSPGLIATPWYDHLSEGERRNAYESTARGLPVGRIGSPDDVAQALVFVLANGFVTGSVIECDGGARIAAG